jgi:hypothetical protein
VQLAFFNAFLFDTQPWREVSNAVDVLVALREVQLGSCIRITGHIQLQQYPSGLPVHRVLGPSGVGQTAQASVTCGPYFIAITDSLSFSSLHAWWCFNSAAMEVQPE